MITAGEGKYKVWLKEEKLGNEMVYILGGGEKPHLGGAVVKEPGKKTKVVKLEGHYDLEVLEPIAKEACKKYNTTVIALGGVHIDNASKDEIEIMVKNCRELVKCI
jgi:hypothetical protein